MVLIVVALDPDGCISRLRMNGHAGNASPNADPACAAITLVARSAARLIASMPGWTVDGTAPEPGNLTLAIQRRPGDATEWLRGVGDTLFQALADIDGEYPGSVSVRMEESENGS